MLRNVMRSLGSVARPARKVILPPSPAFRAGPVMSARFFASKKPKMEDGTLEGRYATALFMASSDNLDKVYNDLVGFRSMLLESKEFKLAVETPGIDPESKVKAFDAICQKAGTDAAVANFLKVLVENKRAHLLGRTIDIFENFYRAEKGLVLCKVSSAEPLSSAQQGQVKAAMTQRAEKGATLIMEYNTNPALLGGLVVKMGEVVLDNSVSTRLERLQTQLLAPVA
mmetsp:Transcript_87539/g.155262  ORF Transcript_87539/g.155262 Transcript_87539/m.155262 type:complete len:227 (+) Transcript_87539:60-740(+)|eukprot:CAMPEP_0197646790 /NCGR_PEP_ID=MMETSP1338-20131121/23852_1 /TAXON_ID=43686 ORGANISM="Pelagodinium beii, Strain RCC1491" /NCGR_SAMPLE_ID=MMETSP1338 /ASSEMBLY_ACC=CAM_ASM_000754 /LENGTH=226 /DNA_ID=CAMNT_0043220453 /DNA_START=60 /DNA_END=740 /DNA_ORIENTATION=-